jgi:hypothetical protein
MFRIHHVCLKTETILRCSCSKWIDTCAANKHYLQLAVIRTLELADILFHIADVSLTNPRPLHVAVCFFGLTWSLQYIVDSLRRQVLDPVAEAGLETTIFLHTYNLTSQTNPRSNEKNVPILSDSWKWLRPTSFLVEDADVVEASFERIIDYYRIGLGAIIVLNSLIRLLSIIVHASLSLELAI